MERATWSSGPGSRPDKLSNAVISEDAAPTIRMDPIRSSLRPTPPVRRPEAVVQNQQRRRRPAPLALRLSVVLLAAVAAAAFAGLVALRDRPAWFVGLRDTSSSVLAPLAPHHASRSSATASPASASPLTVSAVVPSSGVSGQRVSILGSDLVGPGGYLVATFDGSPVPTTCPSEEQCSAVVPLEPPGAGAISVRLRTDTGTS